MSKLTRGESLAVEEALSGQKMVAILLVGVIIVVMAAFCYGYTLLVSNDHYWEVCDAYSEGERVAKRKYYDVLSDGVRWLVDGEIGERDASVARTVLRFSDYGKGVG